MSDPYDAANVHAQAAQIASEISARSGGGESGETPEPADPVEDTQAGNPPNESSRVDSKLSPDAGRSAHFDEAYRNSYVPGQTSVDTNFRPSAGLGSGADNES